MMARNHNLRPLVSVVIPTRNSKRTIGLCLASVAKQTYPRIETIVIDQVSEDRTLKIASTYDAKVLSVRSTEVYLPPTKSRNLGTRASSGDYMMHIDSDMELTPGVIESCIQLCHAGSHAVTIPEVDSYANFWGRCKALERSCYLGDPVHECPRFFSRRALTTIGGYDENLHAGEDWDLATRIREAGFLVARTNQHLIHHIEDFDFVGNLKKKYYYARTLGAYRAKHPEASKETLTVLRRAYLRNVRKLATDPLHLAGMGTQKILEGCCAWLGIHHT